MGEVRLQKSTWPLLAGLASRVTPRHGGAWVELQSAGNTVAVVVRCHGTHATPALAESLALH